MNSRFLLLQSNFVAFCLLSSTLFAPNLAPVFAQTVTDTTTVKATILAHPQPETVPSVQLSAPRLASLRPRSLAPKALPRATQEKLRALLASPQWRDAHIGLCVMALGTVARPEDFPSRPYSFHQKPILFAQDDNKRFLPASNTKLYTAAIALKTLGPNFTFPTRVLSTRKSSINAPDLYLVGGGDPSLKLEDVRALAKSVANRTKVVNNIFSDGSLYQAETFGGRYPDGWTLDDTLWYYGAEINALAFERNQIDVTITGGAKAGDAAKVEFTPQLAGLEGKVEIDVQTGDAVLSGKSWEELIAIERADIGLRDDKVLLKLSGQVAPGQTITEGIATPHPNEMAAASLAQELKNAGVQVKAAKASTQKSGTSADLVEIARHESAPLGVLLQRFLKNSDNLYGEMLLRNAAFCSDTKAANGTAAQGHQLLREWLRSEGVDESNLRFTDGSGLSRYNLITPRATAGLLAAVEKLNGGENFWKALPISGVDGTLKKRMKGTEASGNVRAKTGTFSIVSTLSGYVTTRDGHRLAVSLLTNFVPNGDEGRQLQNEIYTLLAEASWEHSS